MLYWLWTIWFYVVAFFCTVNGPHDFGAPANTPGVVGQTFTRKRDDSGMQQMDNVATLLLGHMDFQKARLQKWTHPGRNKRYMAGQI